MLLPHQAPTDVAEPANLLQKMADLFCAVGEALATCRFDAIGLSRNLAGKKFLFTRVASQVRFRPSRTYRDRAR
jgi:hypothetical protein